MRKGQRQRGLAWKKKRRVLEVFFPTFVREWGREEMMSTLKFRKKVPTSRLSSSSFFPSSSFLFPAAAAASAGRFKHQSVSEERREVAFAMCQKICVKINLKSSSCILALCSYGTYCVLYHA